MNPIRSGKNVLELKLIANFISGIWRTLQCSFKNVGNSAENEKLCSCKFPAKTRLEVTFCSLITVRLPIKSQTSTRLLLKGWMSREKRGKNLIVDSRCFRKFLRLECLGFCGHTNRVTSRYPANFVFIGTLELVSAWLFDTQKTAASRLEDAIKNNSRAHLKIMIRNDFQ